MVSFGLLYQIARLQQEGRIDMVHAAMGKTTGSCMLGDAAAKARNIWITMA